MDGKNWALIINKNKKRIIKEGIKVVSAAYNLQLKFIVGIDITGCTYSYNAPKTYKRDNTSFIENTCDLFIVTPDYIDVPEETLKDHFECEVANKLEKFQRLDSIRYSDVISW